MSTKKSRCAEGGRIRENVLLFDSWCWLLERLKSLGESSFISFGGCFLSMKFFGIGNIELFCFVSLQSSMLFSFSCEKEEMLPAKSAASL